MEEMLALHPEFMRMIRRCAVKTAFIQAVHITFAAYQKLKARIPAGSHISLRDAFDVAIGDKALAMPGSLRQSRVARESSPPGRRSL
uniref:Uncharacterized protein n=1 Tax=Alexandrium andersonii TaxID=327968 RepID=A0A7S2CMZ6_9DINO